MHGRITFHPPTGEDRWNETTTLNSDRPGRENGRLKRLVMRLQRGSERLTRSPEPRAPRPRANTRNSTACDLPHKSLQGPAPLRPIVGRKDCRGLAWRLERMMPGLPTCRNFLRARLPTTIVRSGACRRCVGQRRLSRLGANPQHYLTNLAY